MICASGHSEDCKTFHLNASIYFKFTNFSLSLIMIWILLLFLAALSYVNDFSVDYVNKTGVICWWGERVLRVLRCIPHPLPASASVRGPASAVPGAGHRAAAPPGQHRRLERHLTKSGWSWCVTQNSSWNLVGVSICQTRRQFMSWKMVHWGIKNVSHFFPWM